MWTWVARRTIRQAIGEALFGRRTMAAKIVNLANPDEDETLCATVEEAEQTLAAMVERFKSQG